VFLKTKTHKCIVILTAIILCLLAPPNSRAEDAMPTYIQAQLHTSLSEVGHGMYRKFGFSVYRATLWAGDGAWDPKKPYALELRYMRGVSKDTLVGTVMDDIREQGVADDATLTKWNAVLTAALPEVEDGDVITGLCMPGKKSLLFYNGKQVASIADPVFSKAFFDIWLGKGADEDLRAKLLGHEPG